MSRVARTDEPADFVGRPARLLIRARAGDRSAISELVRLMTPLVWNVVRAQGLDRPTAEDATQNVWLDLLRGGDEIRSPQALTRWLVTVSRREAIRLRDQQRRSQPVDPVTLDLPDEANLMEERVSQDDQYRRLWAHVQRLPHRCRMLLRIVAFVDRPDYDMVSQELKMPRGSIGPTRGRCLNKLRLLLASDPGWSR
ncbi:MAG TPA: sigma-70 family RNA polymerase sigma factor [Micromonosporaceae bacterium]|nr:sigma-70 family RNA polymerase sigma factor [Micromonosporaceae bacterium]